MFQNTNSVPNAIAKVTPVKAIPVVNVNKSTNKKSQNITASANTRKRKKRKASTSDEESDYNSDDYD